MKSAKLRYRLIAAVMMVVAPNLVPPFSMAEKLRVVLKVAAHTLLSFIAALMAGAALYSTIRPILGKERYSQLAHAHTPLMVVLLLIGVALSGVQVYRRWPDRRAFFAWVFPGIWACHLVASRGIAAMEGKWSDPLLLLGIGFAYSVGALITAILTREIFQEHPADLP